MANKSSAVITGPELEYAAESGCPSHPSSAAAQSPVSEAQWRAEQDDHPPQYAARNARRNEDAYLRDNCDQEETSWNTISSKTVRKTTEEMDTAEVERYPPWQRQGGRNAERQRDWLQVFAKVFPWVVRQARATRERIRKLRNPQAPSNARPEIASASSPPLSSPSVDRQLPPATSATPPTNPETNSPSYPSSPDQLHPPGVIPISMSAASATALFQGVAQANVHGGTFNLILVNPTYHSYAPNGFAPPHPAPPSAGVPPWI
ncbi:hypothetical protein BKA70DRAFT_161221 [Coprinopsis sp. MPI-PUGE-AT-0042]|nr:hypothetical protein BKA70DRAFT_161221 [Coprinopsis sp. MPI-PUGE-AT-0042]